MERHDDAAAAQDQLHELAKPGYKVLFAVFAVFCKAADGAWSLVHIHFAA